MSGIYGADVAQLRSLAQQFDGAADRLDLNRMTVGNAIQISAWIGPVAVRFRAQWESDFSRTVSGAAVRLREAALALRRNADDQDRTSAAGSDPLSAKQWSGRGEATGFSAPTSAESLLSGVSGMDAKDSLRVMKVVGDDGETRYIVYFGGTESSGLMTWPSNIGAYNGEQNAQYRYFLGKINEAIGNDRAAEILFVGYSQGGMVAQAIADHSSLNVKSIVTFGSPEIPDGNGYGGADLISLRDPRDPVPKGGGGFLGIGGLGRVIENHVAREMTEGQTPDGLRYEHRSADSGITNIDHHGLDNYARIAREFDESDSARRAKESIDRFAGRVVDDAL